MAERWKGKAVWQNKTGGCETPQAVAGLADEEMLDGKRPFTFIMFDNSQRCCRPGQSASAQVLTIFAQDQRPASGGLPA